MIGYNVIGSQSDGGPSSVSARFLADVTETVNAVHMILYWGTMGPFLMQVTDENGNVLSEGYNKEYTAAKTWVKWILPQFQVEAGKVYTFTVSGLGGNWYSYDLNPDSSRLISLYADYEEPWPTPIPSTIQGLGSGVNFVRFIDTMFGDWVGNDGLISWANYDVQKVEEMLTAAQTWNAKTIRILSTAEFWGNQDYRLRMRDFINRAKAHGLQSILGFWRTSSTETQDNPFPTTLFPTAADFVVFWSSIATEYQDMTDLCFELWNEPNLDVETWMRVANQTVAAIRAAGATNIVIVQHGYTIAKQDNTGSIWTLDWIDNYPLYDPLGRYVYSTHLYRGGFITATGTQHYQKEELRRVYTECGLSSHAPIWIGEIGCNLWETDTENNLAWLTNTLELLKEWNIGYNAWWFWVTGTAWGLFETNRPNFQASSSGKIFIADLGGTPVIPTGKLETHIFLAENEIVANVEIVGIGSYATPFTIDLDPQTYTLNCQYQGQTQTKTASITSGQTTRIDFLFQPLPQQVSINIIIIGKGVTTPTSGTQIFNVGDSMQFTAVPNAGYSFTRWKLNESIYTDNPLTFTITEDMNQKTLTAEFTGPPTPITSAILPAGIAILSVAGLVYYLATRKKR